MSALANPGLEVITMDAPRPLGGDAYHGILGEIVKTNDEYTESDPAAVLFQLYILAGSCIGRGPHQVADASRHGVNEFALVIGKSSDGRKGTSYSNARQFIAPADRQWAEERIKGGLSSGEGLIHSIRDADASDLGVADKRLHVHEPEFAGVLKVMGRRGNTVSELLRQGFDGSGLNILSKNNPARCVAPHVSVSAHLTPADLTFLEPSDFGNGLINRFLVCCSTRSKLLPESTPMPNEKFYSLTAAVSDAIAFAKKVGLMQRDGGAREIWDACYGGLTSGHPGVYGSLTARGAAHVLRLSMICALMDKSYWIRAPHLLCALELWRYCCDSIRFVFGDAVGDRVTDEILSALRRSPQGLSRTTIFDVVFHRNQPADKIGTALQTLAKLRLARCESLPANGKGRPTEVWFAVDSRRTK